MNLDVIVVDDDAVVLFLHKVLIKKSQLPSNVRDFSNAEEALDYINDHPPTKNLLVFLDINMPLYSGWDFLEKINQRVGSKKIFIVMVTSSINESDRRKAGEYAHVVDYREKPLSRNACEEIYTKLLPLLNS